MRELSAQESDAINAKLDAALSSFVQRRNVMGRGLELADRIKRLKANHAAEIDKLAARADALETKAPEAFAKARAQLDISHADLDAMDAELSQLSNQ